MNKYALLTVPSLVFIAACSSDSDSESTAIVASQYPASFDHRVTSISYDFDKNGSIDQVDRFEYDDNGRLIEKSVDRGGDTPSTTTYLYFEDDLIERRSDNDVEKFGYENGQVVSYEYTDGSSALYNEQALFNYDASGRLSSVIGNNTVYYADDCGPLSVSDEDTDAEPLELNITYTNSRITNIRSTDRVYSSDHTYNSKDQITLIEDYYSCYDLPDETIFTYDSEGRISLIEFFTDFYNSTIQSNYDSTGRTTGTVSKDFDFIGAEPKTTTDVYTFNDQNLVVSIDSTTADPNPGFFITPSYVATIEYEAQTCITALTADPLTLATLPSYVGNVRANDPVMCTFPLD